MEKVTRYRALDGSMWDHEDEAVKRDRLYEEVHKIEASIGPKPQDTGCRFANGEFYINHDPYAVREYHAALVEICERELPWAEIFKHRPATDIHPLSIAGRILDDIGIGILNAAWMRLACMDKLGREWGQPYYANNPNPDARLFGT